MHMESALPIARTSMKSSGAKRPRSVIMLAVGGLLLLACDPASARTTINRDDTTPPTIVVNLVGDGFRPLYADSAEPVEGAIDVERPFDITQLRSDSRRVVLVAVAADDESGISQMRGSLDIRFTCHNTGLFSGPSRGETLTRRVDDGFSDEDGTAFRNAPLALEMFTREELWRSRCLHGWEGEAEQRQGRISDIEITYAYNALNNARDNRRSEVTGTFTLPDGNVNLDT